ncbi:MAG: hypothetical protein JNM43_19020 [Planctomycetaceae bacterium]|nr:hypothetical protein [Planctomycetaceae bacterium]
MAKRKTSATDLLAQVTENPEAITRLVNMFFEEIRKKVEDRLSEEMATRVSKTEVANDVARNLAEALIDGKASFDSSKSLRGYLTVVVARRVSDAIARETRDPHNPKGKRFPIREDDAVSGGTLGQRKREEKIREMAAIVNELLEEIDNEVKRIYLSIFVATSDSAADVRSQMPDDQKPSLRACQLWIQQFKEVVQARMRSRGWFTVDEP